MKGFRFTVLSSFTACIMQANFLPPVPTPFAATSSGMFTGFVPDGANPNVTRGVAGNSASIVWGTPAAASGSSSVVFNGGAVGGCFGVGCPGGGPFVLGTITYHNGEIVSGTGVSSFFETVHLADPNDVRLNQDIGFPTFYTVSTPNTSDPVASADYLWIVNSNGFVTNYFHVFEGATSTAQMLAVIVDPPSGLSLEILGFTNVDSNGFLTDTVPEPASLIFVAAGGLAILLRRGRGGPPLHSENGIRAPSE